MCFFVPDLAELPNITKGFPTENEATNSGQSVRNYQQCMCEGAGTIETERGREEEQKQTKREKTRIRPLPSGTHKNEIITVTFTWAV